MDCRYTQNRAENSCKISICGKYNNGKEKLIQSVTETKRAK